MRLRTKLLLGFLGGTTIILVALSSLFLAQMLRQRLETAYSNNNVAAHQVLYSVQHALATGLRHQVFDVNDPEQLQAAIKDTLDGDEDLTSTLNSILRYSPAVYDVNVTDAAGRVIVSTDPTLVDQTLPSRHDFQHLQQVGAAAQLRYVFGQPRVYDVSVPLERNGKPFLMVHVGVRSTFLEAELMPQMRRALLYTLLLVAAAFAFSLLLSAIALRPLTTINLRLDELEGATAQEVQTEATGRDEVAAVSGKIERIGRKIRSVEEVFSELKGNLDQVLANLQDGLVLFTRDGRAVLVSAAATRFLGVSRDEILGRAITEVLRRDSALGRLVLDAFHARFALLQQEVATEDGRRVRVSLDFIHDDTASAGSLGALLTLHDAESAQQLEDELEMSRRLSGIGRLTAGVGHEVKNPINAIVVHMELLRNKLSAATPEAQRHLDVIQGEMQRLNRVISTLVDFTRPVDVRLADSDLRTVTQDVLALTSEELKTRNITVHLRNSPEPLPVHVDRDLIKQALLNIVQNASQAMSGGGTLTVTTAREGRVATVSVADTGTGIPSELLDKIFNLYFTTKSSGSGIGLAMTFRILQLHNGRVLVNSVQGRGSTFTLEIPLVPAERRTAAPVPVEAHASQVQK